MAEKANSLSEQDREMIAQIDVDFKKYKEHCLIFISPV
jgi:hypothetical protein